MQEKKFEEIAEKYELEIERIVETIKKQKAKRVLLQFPDGLKPYATSIKNEIEKELAKSKSGKDRPELIIWMDSCFGACDVPLEAERVGVDLIVQFGHSEWKFD